MIRNIIFDTDIGGDSDDVMALDLLMSAHKAGDCRLTGVTYSADVPYSPALIRSILDYYSFQDVPVGRAPFREEHKPRTKDCYAKPVADVFGGADAPTYETTPDAVKLLRRLLVENGKSTLVVTGWLTNVADLLTSQPDEISPLTGIELVRSCVDEIAVMGGNFSHQDASTPFRTQPDENGDLRPIAEWNIYADIPAAQRVFEVCPVPLSVIPFSLGLNMISGGPMVKAGGENRPDSYSFIVHESLNGRHSWDPATALYAVYGTKPWFYRSAPGKVTITDEGISHFDASRGGNCRLLGCAMEKAAIAAAMDEIVMNGLYK